MGRLQDKTAIITGAASGIGRAVAVMFAREGCHLALADVNQDDLAATGDLVTRAGGRMVLQQTDVSVEGEVKALIESALAAFGQVDILCNNAGITGTLAGPTEQDADDWRRVFEVNVLGAVYGVKHLAAHFIERRAGAVVNTSSVAGVRSGAGGNAYSASKAALINFTQTAACDLGQYGVRVNAVCPGLIETGMTKMVFDYARAQDKMGKVGSRCELKRYGRPEEVAAAILFLASDEASYITGQALPVDGGNTASLNLPGMKF